MSREASPPSRKAADADVLGEAASLPVPGTDPAAQPETPAAPGAPAMPEPPPAEDENQPGFIGERNRPSP
jgi:hypothetical protein